MSTRPAKSLSLSSTAAACVASLGPDDVEVSELLPLHPAATSARATMVMCIKRIESVTFLHRNPLVIRTVITILKGVDWRLLTPRHPE
jgi:hypothetical protein